MITPKLKILYPQRSLTLSPRLQQRDMRNLVRYLLIIAFLCLISGCALLPQRQHRPPEVQSGETQLTPSPVAHHPWWNPFRALNFKFPFFHHHQTAPRAEVLLRVGTVRTVSQDGTYVIIELDPGTYIPPGRNLFVTDPTGEIARLRSAESNYQYFTADVLSGQPLPGQIVQQ